MANWNVLKAAVANIINANGNQEITGQLLQNVLNNIITNVGENATFAGIATLDTNPGAPDGPVFYLATTTGVYPNFNGLEVLDGEAIIFLWNNSAWTKKVTGFATQEKLSQLGSKDFNNYFEGIGGNYTSIKIEGLIPNHKYRCYLRNLWEDSTDNTSAQKFNIESYNSSNELTVLKGYKIGADIPVYMDFTVPYDSVRIEIGGRAIKGEKVWFNIVDIEHTDSLKENIATISEQLDTLEKLKVLELKIISSSQSEYNNIEQGEYSYNPSLKNIYYVDNSGFVKGMKPNNNTLYIYNGRIFRITLEDGIVLNNIFIPISKWSGDAEILLSAGKGNFVYNTYNKTIQIVTESQLWGVKYDEKSLFIFDSHLYEWDKINNTLVPIKDIYDLTNKISEVEAKSDKGVTALNNLNEITVKSVGEDLTAESEMFDVLISATNGDETEYNGAKASDYIPIIGNKEYYISGSMAWSHAVYAWYDESKNYIGGYAAAGGSTITKLVNELVLAPQNAAYIRVCRWTTNQEGKVNEVKLSAISEGTASWKGKKWVCIGDSLTERNSRATKNYHDYVAEATGIEVVNMGASGTGYKRQEENGRAFYQRVENIPSDADVITIFGSGNDGAYWGSNLGTALDATTDTIGGCINITIDNIFAKMPLAVVGIVSPTPWNNNKPGDDTMMKKYANLLKQICENRGIPFLDLFQNSGLRPWDESFKQLAYSRDEGGGVHPDENGHKLIAPRFKAFLETLIM